MRMPWPRWHGWAALVAALGVACADGPAAPTTMQPPGPAALPRVIVVTHTTGFRHSSIDVAERVLPTLGRDAGLYTVETSTIYPQGS